MHLSKWIQECYLCLQIEKSFIHFELKERTRSSASNLTKVKALKHFFHFVLEMTVTTFDGILDAQYTFSGERKQKKRVCQDEILLRISRKGRLKWRRKNKGSQMQFHQEMGSQKVCDPRHQDELQTLLISWDSILCSHNLWYSISSAESLFLEQTAESGVGRNNDCCTTSVVE